MLDVLQEDYVRTAKAKGLGRNLVLFRHALKNAALPVVTIVGLQMGTLLAGAVLTETIFSWPGIDAGYMMAFWDVTIPSFKVARWSSHSSLWALTFLSILCMRFLTRASAMIERSYG